MNVICDIDNTLLLKGVQPMQAEIDALNGLGADVYLVTGRAQAERTRTLQAVKAAGIKYRMLLMNGGKETPADQLQSKQDNATMIKRMHGPIDIAIDDNASAQNVYRALGVARVISPQELVSLDGKTAKA